jgi:hypothetical protein
MEEDLVYNPAWFQQQEESPFTTMVDQAIASQQQSQQQSEGLMQSPDTQSGLLSMFEEMKDMMSQLEVIKSQQAESQQVAQQEADDDLSDIEDFRAIFGEDDVNTPIDWQARTNYKNNKDDVNATSDWQARTNYKNNTVAQEIYSTVLKQTGNAKKAENAVKIAYHESTLNPRITNKYNMAGLYQFSPPNQRKYNVNENSSIQEQTNAWLQYQQDNNIPIGQEGVGQLAPAYLGKNVIYKRGTKAYEANKGLDKNKDGLMTSAEINNWYNL